LKNRYHKKHISLITKNKIKKYLLNFSLILLKFLILFKKTIDFLSFYSLVKPFYIIARFIFSKIIVKIYYFYFYITKKYKLSHFRGQFFAFLIYQRLVHVLVFVLSFIICFNNLTQESNTNSIDEIVSKTVLFKLIKSEFNDLEFAEELIEESIDENANIIAGQPKYIDETVYLKNKKTTLTKETEEEIDEENIDNIPVTDQSSAMIKPEIVTTKKTILPRKETIIYTVNAGDTISSIAKKFKISVNTILWENNLTASSLIRPGDQLDIPPGTGINHVIRKGETLSKIAQKYDVKSDKILLANDIEEANKIKIGQKIFIPDGEMIYTAQKTTPKRSLTAIKEAIQYSKTKKQSASNKMCWPTSGHRITQYYSWRHRGLDIANKTGTPLYAAEAGTIEYAGWTNGYGYNIIINHGGGKKTRYAHASKFYVKKGDYVNRCQRIAAMGSTGWSTGPHIHFEVIINGSKYNPLNYIR